MTFLLMPMYLTCFQVLEQAKDNLTEWGFVPGDPYPNNKTVQDCKYFSFFTVNKESVFFT